MKIIATNKRAFFEYEILDKYEAGIVLEGSEVKSARCASISLVGSFVHFVDFQPILKNCYIKNYDSAGNYKPDEKRNRKLLLNKREIQKIYGHIHEKGLTAVPLKVYFNEDNLLKVEVGVGRGKKLYDKRESIKAKENKRELDRKLKKVY